MTWSYSRVSTFDDCRYRWFLKYICQCTDIPMFYSSYGTFMHKILEEFYRGIITKDEMQMRFLTGFSTEVLGDRPSESIAQNYISSGLAYLSSFIPLPYNMLAVEKRISFKLGSLDFVGVIDYIGELDGEIYIVDNKSRDLKQRTKRKKPTKNDLEIDKMLRQLYIYAGAIKTEYGKYPKYLCFNCFKNREFIKEEFKESTYLETVKQIDEEVNIITNEEDFTPFIDYFYCRYLCGVHDECVYYNSGGKK